jgi:hypothetical protein
MCNGNSPKKMFFNGKIIEPNGRFFVAMFDYWRVAVFEEMK